MALEQEKVVTITAESKVDGVVISRLSSTVSSKNDVNSAYSEQVVDTAAYKTNKVAARKDMADFRLAVYALEDELALEEKPVL